MYRKSWAVSVVVFGLLLLPATARAQQWAWTYGGVEIDGTTAAQENAGGGYTAAGSTRSVGSGQDDFWLLSLDSTGLVAWEKTYGGTGSDTLAHMQQTAAGGYVMVGTTDSFGAGGCDVWLLKVGGTGDLSSLQRTYGGTGSDTAAHVEETSDTGFIVAATTESFGATSGDIWVLKVTSEGAISWQKRYGGSESNRAAHIEQTSDNGYIVAGTIGTNNGDYWLLKLASDGAVQWQKAYGLQTFVPPDQYNDNTEICHHVSQTTDGGYIVSGVSTPSPSGNTRAWVLKLESDGDVTWERWYSILGDVSETSVLEGSDGYIVAGGSSNDAWIMKLDTSTSGTVAWARRYGGASSVASDVFASVLQTTDSGLIVAGRMESFGVGQSEAWLLKMDGNGQISDCPAMDDLSVGSETTSADVTTTTATTTDTGVAYAGTSVTAANAQSVRRYGCVLAVASDTRVRLARTGQTTTYSSKDDGDLQKGVAWPTARFTDNLDGTVTDELTGLMWLKDGNCAVAAGYDPDGTGTGAMTWTSGVAFVEGINDESIDVSGCASYTAEHSDWRYANVNEMESLLNAEATDPAAWLNGQGFANVQSGRYFTSTARAWLYPQYNKWTVTFEAAALRPIEAYGWTGNQFIWPVRAGQRDYADSRYPANLWKTGQTASFASGDDGALEWGVSWPEPRFTDNGDGTVTDNLTGLVWLKDANCFGSLLWQPSLDAVEDFNANPDAYECEDYTAANKDWRLPNRRELVSLVDRSRFSDDCLPADHPFVNVNSGSPSTWWTSTTDPSNDGLAYRNTLVGTATMERASKTVNPSKIWPVRGPYSVALPGVNLLLLLDDPP